MSSLREAMTRFSPVLRRLGGVIVLGIIPLAVGIGLAQLVAPQPAVGIVKINAEIWPLSLNFFMQEIEEARRDPHIKAVVIQVDSPGGEVVATQSLYLEIQKLRSQMPVVASIDSTAASGAYYVAVAADSLYAKPSSIVGNIGVWGIVPPDIGVNDDVLASGPFKLTASNQEEFIRRIEGIKQEFIATVVSQRGERLKISPVDLAQGLAYAGREAQHLGLIDHLGTQADAVAAVAAQAGIVNYDVIDLEARVVARLLAGTPTPPASWSGAADPQTGRRQMPPGVYLLYDAQLGGAP